MFRIGSQYILKGALKDGTVIYYHKTQEYVMDPSKATFFKNKKQAEKIRSAWEEYWKTVEDHNENNTKLKINDINSIYGWHIKEVQLMLIP